MIRSICTIASIVVGAAIAASPAIAETKIAFVSIGQLDWMSQNVATTTFRNGDPIPDIDDPVAWARSGKVGRPATALYPGAKERPEEWGRLYNYAAVIDPRGLCPLGWRVPDDADWTALERQLGPVAAARRLRARSGWMRGAGLDDVGFAALPAGFRTQRGDYFLGGRVAYFWSMAETSQKQITAHMLFDYDSKIFRIVYDQAMGMSLRCVRERTRT